MSKSVLKRGILKIYLSTSFAVYNFGKTGPIRLIFFSKCWKLNINFKDPAGNWERTFCFLHNSIWIGCCKLSLLQREYLPYAINVWTNSTKILDMTNRDFSEPRFFMGAEKIFKNCCREDCSSAWDSLICWLS